MLNVTITTNSINEFVQEYSTSKDVLKSLSNNTVTDIAFFPKGITVVGFKIDFLKYEIVLDIVNPITNEFLDKLSVVLLNLLDQDYIFNYSYSYGSDL